MTLKIEKKKDKKVISVYLEQELIDAVGKIAESSDVSFNKTLREIIAYGVEVWDEQKINK